MAEGVLLVVLAVVLEALVDYVVDKFKIRPSHRRKNSH